MNLQCITYGHCKCDHYRYFSSAYLKVSIEQVGGFRNTFFITAISPWDRDQIGIKMEGKHFEN